MTYPPPPPGPSGSHGEPDQPGSSGSHDAPPSDAPGQPAYGGQPPQQQDSYAAPGQPVEQGGWDPSQPAPGGQPPFGAPHAGFGQTGGYSAPSARARSPLPWILAGGGALVVIVVVIVLVFTLGGDDGGGTDSPRAVAEAFVTAVNERKLPQQQIFCDAFVQEGEEMTRGLPDGAAAPTDEPGFESKATLDDVEERGDTATAVVRFELGSGGESIKGEYHLSIRKEDGNWRICDFEVGNIEIPGLGG